MNDELIVEEKAKMGRPEIEIDTEKLAAFCRLKPTLADCAAFFKCSEDTVERRIKDNFGLTFAEFRDQNMVHTRFSLARKAIQMAESGNPAMMIFCLKNLCGWTDRNEAGVVVNNNVNNDVIKIELKERIRQLRESGAGT